MSHTSTDQPRVLKGVPAAGRFANRARPEAATVLAPVAAPSNNMPRLGSGAAGYTDRFDDAGNLILQVRLENGRPNDAPDGTAAIIRYSTAPQGATTEKFYTDGVLSDGSGDKPTERKTWPSGRSIVTRGYLRPHQGYITPQDSPDGQPATVQTTAEGHVTTTHYTSGALQDPEPGIPAREEVLTDGTRKIAHAPYGRMSDLTDGTPSERHYHPDGSLAAEFRRHDGQGWDSDDGDPSERRYHPDGSLAKEVFRYRGRLLNSPDGKPSLTEYDMDGKVTRIIDTPWLQDQYGPDVRYDQRRERARAWPYARTERVERYVPEPPKQK